MKVSIIFFSLNFYVMMLLMNGAKRNFIDIRFIKNSHRLGNVREYRRKVKITGSGNIECILVSR